MFKELTCVLAAIYLCHGAPSNDGSWKIIGGSEAAPGAAPHQIMLKIAPNSFNCAGSILSKRSVLTAAHCVDGYRPENLVVVAGSNLLSTGGVTYKVESYVVHEDYNFWEISNDVAIMFVSEDIEFSDKIQPIALETDYIEGGSTVTLTGWGMTSYPGPVSETLQTIDLLAISYEDCKERWSAGNTVYPSQICTLTKKGEGACKGDSGGPLTRGGKLVGVVSWGNPCANGMPDVYSRINTFTDWIITNVK